MVSTGNAEDDYSFRLCEDNLDRVLSKVLVVVCWLIHAPRWRVRFFVDPVGDASQVLNLHFCLVPSSARALEASCCCCLGGAFARDVSVVAAAAAAASALFCVFCLWLLLLSMLVVVVVVVVAAVVSHAYIRGSLEHKSTRKIWRSTKGGSHPGGQLG